MRIELKENVAAIICETFAHAMIDSGDRFNYTFESIVDGKLYESESYHGFLSEEHAEQDARREVDRYEIPKAEPIITAPRKPENWHVHVCFHDEHGIIECVNPLCWKDERRFETDQIECAKCGNMTGRLHHEPPFMPKVNRHIPPDDNGPQTSGPTPAAAAITDSTHTERWTQLLHAAVSEPGMLLKAYSAFHGYSLGNQMLAMMQCAIRGIEPGPINTFMGWKVLNRQVQKGQKALTLCMPLAGKNAEGEAVIRGFAYKPRWFVLSQTEGEPYELPPIPAWSKELALEKLSITEEAFTDTNGNTQGYSIARRFAVSPVAAVPHKTLFHELAHIVLGHTEEANYSHDQTTPRSIQELEAEATALLILDALELPGSEYCRGYIQNWFRGERVPEASAQAIFSAADKILKAGQRE